MANSDNAYGVFNKQTKIMYQKQHWAIGTDEDGIKNTGSWNVISQNFSGNLETAKNFFLTAEALACINDNGTQVQFAITSDGNGLKWTVAFGIKADPSEKPWAEKFTETKDALISANGWAKSDLLVANTRVPGSGPGGGAKGWFVEDSSDHLF